MTGDNTTGPKRVTAWVHGAVQGVGFRWWVYSQAKELRLNGSATNLLDGRVCIVAEGDGGACEELVHRLQVPRGYRRPGSVDAVIVQWSDPRGGTGFEMK